MELFNFELSLAQLSVYFSTRLHAIVVNPKDRCSYTWEPALFELQGKHRLSFIRNTFIIRKAWINLNFIVSLFHHKLQLLPVYTCGPGGPYHCCAHADSVLLFSRSIVFPFLFNFLIIHFSLSSETNAVDAFIETPPHRRGSRKRLEPFLCLYNPLAIIFVLSAIFFFSVHLCFPSDEPPVRGIWRIGVLNKALERTLCCFFYKYRAG